MKESRTRGWRSLGLSRRQKTALRKAPTACRLGYERLEERRLLAFIVPDFNSRLGAPKTLHLDFNGSSPFDWHDTRAHGAGDDDNLIPAFSIDGNVFDFSQPELDAIEAIYKQVAEKFSPFNINVTTVAPPNYNDGAAVQMIFSGKKTDWYDPDNEKESGGVAIYDAFLDDDFENNGFVFTDDAIPDGSTTLSDATRHYIAETAAHEAGHMFRLHHQSDVNPDLSIRDPYSDGNATTAPIMGGSSQNANRGKRGIWQRGPSSKQDGDDHVFDGEQHDFAILQSVLGLAPDDAPEGVFRSLLIDQTTGLVAANQKGVIEAEGDADQFLFRAISTVANFSVKNAALGGMLLTLASIINPATGQVIAFDYATDAASNTATVTASGLVPGTEYILEIEDQFLDGHGGYTIDGSVGSFASLVGGVLTIRGFGGLDNSIGLSYHSGFNRLIVTNESAGGTASQLFTPSFVNRINFDLIGNKDDVRVAGITRGIPIYVTANDGLDSLTIDDSQEAATIPHSVSVSDVSVVRATSGVIVFHPVSYSGLKNLTYIASAGTHVFDVLGTASLPGGQTTIHATGGADLITVTPRSLDGPTIMGQLGVFGGGGSDEIIIDDRPNLTGATWEVSNPFNAATQNFRVGGGALIGAYSDIESVRLIGSHYDDVFNINSYMNGSALRINGGAGDDDVNVTPNTLNLSSFITSMSYFEFEGAADSNSFNVYNSGNNNSWQYTRTSGQLQTLLPGTSYFGHYNLLNAGAVSVHGGPQHDVMIVEGTPSGSRTDYYGGGGADQYAVFADPNNISASLQGIRGPIGFHSDGSDSFMISGSDTTGRTLHITSTQIGHAPGDNYFGPGGYVELDGSGTVLSLALGSGADMVYAVPNPSTQLQILAGDPTTTPGDKLTLLLAGVTNPMLTPLGAGTGLYTFGNAAQVHYVGFETVTTTTVGGDFNGDGVVNGGDLNDWKAGFGVAGGAGDADRDGDADGADFLAWQRQQGAVLAVAAAVPAAIAATAPANQSNARASLLTSATADHLADLAGALERRSVGVGRPWRHHERLDATSQMPASPLVRGAWGDAVAGQRSDAALEHFHQRTRLSPPHARGVLDIAFDHEHVEPDVLDSAFAGLN
jgi:hypothetical protein